LPTAALFVKAATRLRSLLCRSRWREFLQNIT
jgi:hypothetical protein